MLAHETPRRYPSATSVELLTEARHHFRRLGLADGCHVVWGEQVLLFPWAGGRVLGTLVIWLTEEGWDVTGDGLALGIEWRSAEAVRDGLAALLEGPPPDPLDLAASVRNLRREKFHPYLDEDLLAADFARRSLDVEGAYRVLRELLDRWQPASA
jgi:hypothetical protein